MAFSSDILPYMDTGCFVSTARCLRNP